MPLSALAVADDPLGPATASEAVLQRLRADLVGGHLAPRARLAMKPLMARYGVGLSPLREALHRLAGQGWVQAHGQRGFRVPPASLDDLADLTALREMVERAAVAQAVQRGDDAWESRLVACVHRLQRLAERSGDDPESFVAAYGPLHRDFHLAMFDGVVAPRLAALQADLFDQAQRYRSLLHCLGVQPQALVDEHRGLLEVLLRRDAAAAGDELAAHLQLTLQAWRAEAAAPAR